MRKARPARHASRAGCRRRLPRLPAFSGCRRLRRQSRAPRRGAGRGRVRARPCRGGEGGRRHGAAPALALVLAGLLLVVSAAPAPAQIPVTDAAHIALNSAWHYLHYLQFAFQIYQHYVQIGNQLRQIEYQLRALQKLEHPNWRDIQSLLYDLDALARSGRAIGYALPDAGGQLRQVYPGWTPWTDPTAAPLQAERALDTMRAGLAAISRQSQSLAPGEQTLAAIRQQMTGTAGHQQALEQLATLGSFTAQEQLLARQSLAVNANLQAVGQAYWIDREAQARATFRVLTAETALAAYQSNSPGWTFVPRPTLP
jgi:P-type conjugative transfer protein TrbJ